MSTGSMFWRQEQSFVDRSTVVAIEAILEVARVDKGKMLSTEAMSTGAVFCRQEPRCGDSNPGGRPCRQGQDVWAAWELGAPVWAAWELVWTAWARLTWPQGGVLSTGAMWTGAFLEVVPAAGAV